MSTDIPTLKNISNDHRHQQGRTEVMTTDIPKLKNIMTTDIPVQFDKSWKQVAASTSNSTVWISQSSFVKKSNLKNRQNN